MSPTSCRGAKGCVSQAVLSLEVLDKALPPGRGDHSEGVGPFSHGLSRTPRGGSWWGTEPSARSAQQTPSTDLPTPWPWAWLVASRVSCPGMQSGNGHQPQASTHGHREPQPVIHPAPTI